MKRLMLCLFLVVLFCGTVVGDASSVFEIESAYSDCFEEGDSGFIRLTVRNIGSFDASFSTVTECDFPFSATGSSITQKVSKGSIQTIKIPISAATNEAELKRSCNIKVKEEQNPSNYDITQVPVCVKNLRLCETNDMFCSGNEIKQCNDAGNWETVRACKEGCKVQSKDYGDKVYCNEDIPSEIDTVSVHPFAYILIALFIIVSAFLIIRSKKKGKGYCPKCGEKISLKNKHCPECGSKT